MSIKKAVDQDKSADRKDRPVPSHREPVAYNLTEGRGATNVEFSKDQTTRSHEFASDSEAKSQGATVPGEDGMSNSMRRAKAITKRRKETEAVFDANRKKSSTI